MNNFLVWNARGLGTFHNCLRKLVKKYHVGLVAILEPFKKEEHIHKYVQFLAFTNSRINEI